MAENKYNIKDELLEADRKMTGSLALTGMTALSQPLYNNSTRSVMFTSHLKQSVNLLDPDYPYYFTNVENLVGKHSSGYKKIKHDSVVFRKVVKYEGIIDNPEVFQLFIFDEKKQKFDVIERKSSENLTEVFGYKYNNDVIDNLEENDPIDKGTVLFKSSSYDETMNYRYGKNVPYMYTLKPITSEDACSISYSLANEMRSIETNTISIGVNQNDFLLNLYGDEYEYKPFPDIGEFANGLVAVKRTLFGNRLLAEFKDSALNKRNDSDTSFYYTGKVIDITIYCNNDEIEDTPFNHQILKYLDAQTKYYQEIKEVCEEIIESGYGYSQNINYLYRRSCEFINNEKKWKDTDSVFGNLLIEITVENNEPLRIGQKVTARYGNKSVVAEIVPDDEMPYYYDENGEKHIVHMLLNVLAIINRTTASPLYEGSVTFIAAKTAAHMKTLKTRKEQEDLLFSVINDFNERQAAEMRAVYNKLSSKEKDAYIQDCINGGIYINIHPMWETKPMFYRLLDIYKKYDFLTPYDMYINKWGRQIKLLNKSYIGSMYMLKLKQTSRKGFIARGTGSINCKGLPERSYKNKSFTELYSNTPIRFGEFETLNFSIAMVPEDIQLFHLQYRTSAKGRRDIAKQLLSPMTDDAFEIHSSYTSTAAQIFAVYLKSLGLRLRFIDDDDEFKEYNDSQISVHEYEGKEYLCTEYQFMLVKRRKEVEKEVLHECGLIDTDEFNKIVMERLISRSYIIGPDKSEYPVTPGLQPDTVD